MLILSFFSKKENTKEEEKRKGRKVRRKEVRKKKDMKEGKKRGSPFYCVESIPRYFYLNENISYFKYLYSMPCLETDKNCDSFQ